MRTGDGLFAAPVRVDTEDFDAGDECATVLAGAGCFTAAPDVVVLLVAACAVPAATAAASTRAIVFEVVMAQFPRSR